MAPAPRRTTPEPDPQDSLFDEIINNELLAAALERREAERGKRSQAATKFKEADEAARGIIAGLDLDDDTTVRCGRFRITRKPIAGRHVEFDSEPTMRLSIGVIPTVP